MDENYAQARTGAESGAQTPPLSNMLGALLANPELMGRIKELVGNASQTEQVPPAAKAEEREGGAQAAFSPSADGLASLLNDPAILEKLPTMLAVLKPLLYLLINAPPQN